MAASNLLKTKRGSYTLIELLIVVAIIAILIMILLPAIGTARSLGRQSVCAANLRSLGQMGESYCASYNDWLVGSPNTSGNGANPDGDKLILYNPSGTYDWSLATDANPAIHIFDWATPLLQMMRGSVPASVPDRYAEIKKWVFLCPDNGWSAFLNHVSRIGNLTAVSSYATSRYFTCVPVDRRTGTLPGTLFWYDDFMPSDFLPRMDRIENASWKVFLADACRVDRGNPPEISNMDYGYTERGAWLNEKDPEDKDLTSLSYRFRAAKEQAYRHRGGLNIVFFDGHVEHQPEGSSETNNGYGSQSRQARFWFPSGTDTSKIPSAGDFSNRKIIVP